MVKQMTVDGPEVIESLLRGAVGVLPTDTVYGVVCSAALPDAVARLYALKDRHDKPGTVIAANIEQLVALGIPKRYLTAVMQYWPNPISVVIPLGDTLSALHLGKGSLACRVPNDAKLLQLLEHTGPLLTSSANHPGEPPATTLQESIDYFGDEVDFYVDGGNFEGHQSSTVIRIVDDAVEVLREGTVKINEYGAIQE